MQKSLEQYKKEVATALEIVHAVGAMIQELGQIPSGELYALLMDKMSIETYDSMIRLMVNSKLIRSDNHLLIWIGPVTGVARG